jgi:hypothetical protein
LAGPSIVGTAKHAVGTSRLKHISAMSHDPANLRFLNNIKPFITFATVTLGFRTVASEWSGRITYASQRKIAN